MTWVDCAVEVLSRESTQAEARWTVGSGFLLRSGRVLTAAHNVRDPHRTLVRLMDGTEHGASVLLHGGDDIDLAILTVPELEGHPSHDRTGSGFARVARDQAGLIAPCTGIGFPRYKEDATRRSVSGTPTREPEQLDGAIPTTARLRSGLLTLRLTAAPRELRAAGDSPWRGVSGTAILATLPIGNEAIIGIVVEHHVDESAGSVTVLPITAIDDMLSAATASTWWRVLGVASPAALPILNGHQQPSRPTAPPPPRSAIERTALLDQVFDSLRQPARRHLALVGGPGFGKSVIARQVAHLVESKGDDFAALSGGVLWVDVGQQPELAAVLTQALSDLTGRTSSSRSTHQLARELGEELSRRRCLTILDDVWGAALLELLLPAFPDVAVIVTTRKRGLSEQYGLSSIDVDRLTRDEAQALLMLGLSQAEVPEPANRDLEVLSAFAAKLAGWPLVIALASAHLRRRVSVGLPLTAAVDQLANRLSQKGLVAFDPDDAGDLDPGDQSQRTLAVSANVEASLSLLSDQARAAYRGLGVHPVGQPIPLSVAEEQLAPRLAADAVTDLLLDLADLSLVFLDMNTEVVRVHDLLHEFLATGSDEVHRTRHRELLALWGDAYRCRDAYKLRWITYHMLAGGMGDEVIALLTPEWRDHVATVTGAVADVVSDVVRARDWATTTGRIAEEVKFRLILTSLEVRIASVPTGLLVAMTKGGWANLALGYARVLRPDRRRRAEIEIAMMEASTDPHSVLARVPRFGDARTRDGVRAAAAATLAATDVAKALDVVHEIEGPFGADWSMADIAREVAKNDPVRALEIVEGIRDAAIRGDAVLQILRPLAIIDPDVALAQAAGIADRGMRDGALTDVGLVFAESGRFEKAAAIADHLMTSKFRDLLRTRIAVLLADRQTAVSLSLSERVERPWLNDQAIEAVVLALACRDTRAALRLVRACSVGEGRRHALLALVRFLGGEHPYEALALIAAQQDEEVQADGYVCLVRATGSRDVDLAMHLAAGIRDPRTRDSARAALVRDLAELDPARAIRLAHQVEGRPKRQEALANVALVCAELYPGPAMAAAALLNGTDSEPLLSAVARAMARWHPHRALQLCERLLNVETRWPTVADCGLALAATDVNAALEVVYAVPDPALRREALAQIALTMAEDNPERAVSLVARENLPQQQTRLLVDLSAGAALTDLDRSFRLVRRINDTRGYEELIERVLPVMAREDPAVGLRFIARLPSAAMRGRAAEQLAWQMVSRDTEYTIRVVSRFIASEKQDEVYARFVRDLGDLAPAVELSRMIVDPALKEGVLVELAERHVAREPREAADLVLGPAVYTPSLRNSVLSIVAVRLAADSLHEAVELVQRITDARERSRSLARLVQMAAVSDPTRALELATMVLPEDRGELWDSLAEILPQFEIQHLLRALKFAAESDATGRLVGRLASRLPVEAAHSVADLAERVEGTELRDQILAATLRRSVRSEEPSVLLTEALRIEDDVQRDLLLIELAAALVAHDPDAALTFTEHIRDLVSVRSSLVQVIARLPVRTLDAGLELLAAVRETDVWPDAVSAVLPSLTTVDFERALTLAGTVEGDGAHDRALGKIAVASAAAYPERALRVAGTIAVPGSRDSVLAEVADSLATTDYRQAWAITRAVVDVDRRAEARGAVLLRLALEASESVLELVRALPEDERDLCVPPTVRELAERNFSLAADLAATICDAEAAEQTFDMLVSSADTAERLAIMVHGAERISDASLRGRTLSALVMTLAGTDLSAAVSVARTIEDAIVRSDALKEAANEIIDYDALGAWQLVGEIESPQLRSPLREKLPA